MRIIFNIDGYWFNMFSWETLWRVRTEGEIVRKSWQRRGRLHAGLFLIFQPVSSWDSVSHLDKRFSRISDKTNIPAHSSRWSEWYIWYIPSFSSFCVMKRNVIFQNWLVLFSTKILDAKYVWTESAYIQDINGEMAAHKSSHFFATDCFV